MSAFSLELLLFLLESLPNFDPRQLRLLLIFDLFLFFLLLLDLSRGSSILNGLYDIWFVIVWVAESFLVKFEAFLLILDPIVFA